MMRSLQIHLALILLFQASFAVAVNPNCNCVVFRFDDVQDWWIVPAQKAVMDTFKNASKTPISPGIIANYFGADSSIVTYMRNSLQVSGWDFNVVSHGWEHEQFNTFTKAQQKTKLLNSRTRILSYLGSYGLQNVTSFIPPFNEFDSNTIAALTELGYTSMSSQVELDPAPYVYGNSSFYRWPEGAATSNNDISDYYVGVSAETTFAQIQAQIASHGFSVVMMHPQEFCVLDGNNEPTAAVDWNQISELRDLIGLVKSAGIKITTLDKLKNEFSATTAVTTKALTTKALTTKALTTKSLTTKALTTKAITSRSTTAAVTSARLTTSRVTTSQPVNPNCNCVVFRFDDIQDWWIVPAQQAVMDTFKNASKAPISPGIIANFFGADSSIVNYMRNSLQVSGWDFNVVSHGWEHEQFNIFTKAQQKTKLLNSRTRILSYLGSYGLQNVTSFIPPFNEFDSNTIAALTELGYTSMSSQVELDPAPYIYGNSSFYRWPEGAATSNVNIDDYYVGVPAATTFAQITSQIERDGFSVVMMHPQEFCVLDSNNQPTAAVDWSQINELRNLIGLVRAAGIKITTLDKLKNEFSSTAAVTTARGTSGALTTAQNINTSGGTTKAVTTGITTGISTGSQPVTTAAPAAVTTGAVQQPTTGCNCISFVLAQVEDWWQADTAVAIINEFKNASVPLTVGVIASSIGSDSRITNAVSGALSTCTPEFEIAANGYIFSAYQSKSLSAQQSDIASAKTAIDNVFGVTPKSFLPPQLSWNANTLTALQNEGISVMSVHTDVDPAPHPREINMPVWRFPAGASTYDTDSGVGISAEDTWDQIEAQIAAMNYSVVLMTPTEFSTSGNLNTARIQELRDLIYLAKTSGKAFRVLSGLPSGWGGPAGQSNCARRSAETRAVESRLI